MIPDAEIARARAALPDILPMPLKRESGILKGLCPFHSEKSPSFTVWPDGHYFCFGCGAHGTAIDYVMQTKNVDFPTAVRELLGVGGAKLTSSRPRASVGENSGAPLGGTGAPHFVSELWNGATQPSLASWYLWSRGLTVKTLPTALRGHERVWCTETHQHRPCMLAAITDETGRITAVLRTWIEVRLEYDGRTEFPKGARAADLKAPKKTLGLMGTGSVKLAAAEETLGLSEGNESALAAARLYRLPVWALAGLSRFGMPQYVDDKGRHHDERPPKIFIPREVRHLVFFGDNGDIGHRVADYACWWWRRQGLDAQPIYPDPAYGDFNDQVLG